jgi:copper chaperone CopZ
MTPSRIELATFRFVAQHLNHCATAVPDCINNIDGKYKAEVPLKLMEQALVTNISRLFLQVLLFPSRLQAHSTLELVPFGLFLLIIHSTSYSSICNNPLSNIHLLLNQST